MRCWAGCSREDIYAAMGIEKRHLFYDDVYCTNKRTIQGQGQDKKHSDNWRRQSTDLQYLFDALFLRAERILSQARGIDISSWSDHDVTRVSGPIAQALNERAESDQLADMAFGIRDRGLSEEQENERRRRKDSERS